MPIIPEKRQLEDHVHGALAAQFWSQGIENTRSLTGQACTAPCEPQPLRLHAPSGLSRTQFLVAAHAVRVPVFPGFCEEHGGTVLDRVLLQSGGQKWWGAIIGRAKLQRAVQQRSAKTLRRILADPDNYVLAATGRLQISSSTSLKFTAQVDSLAHLQPLMPQGGRIWHQQQQQPQQQQQQRGWTKMGQNSSLCMQVKQQLEGLDLTADLALNEPSVEGVRRYATTPLRLAVDVAPSSSSSTHGSSSSSSRLKGMLFRVGLHGVVAPVEGGVPGDSQPQQQPQQQQPQQQQQHALSVHCQGAVALSGNKTVWEASQKPWQSAAAAAKDQRAKRLKQRQRQLEAAQQAVEAQDRQQQQQQQQAELQVQPLQLGSSSNGAGLSPDASTLAAAAAAAAVTGAGANAAADAASPGAAAAGGSEEHATSSKHHRHRHHHKSSSSRHATAKSGNTTVTATTRNTSSIHTAAGRKRCLTLQGQEIPLPLLSPANVQDTLQESGSRLERLRSELRQLRGRVEAGDLQQLGSGRKAGGLLAGLGKDSGSCWSSFLDGPHFKVSGLVGLLGRVPLQQRTLLLPGSISTPTHQQQAPQHSSSTASLASTSTADGAGSSSAAADNASAAAAAAAAVPSGRPLASKARSFLAASATHLDRLVLGSAKKLGTNIRQESQLRLFGSGGASLQLGEMRGKFFDYTRLEAALDLALNAPETSSAAATAAAAAAAAAGSSSRVAAAGAGSGGQRQQRGARTAAAKAGGGAQQRTPGRGMGSILGPAAAVELATAATPAAAPSEPAAAATPAPAASRQQQPASKHPAFALEDRCVWNALTLSASQQLVGPVRLRGDWRFALDSKHACPSGMGLLQPSAPLALLRHVGAISPALVDSAFGVDVVVPGAGGLVRLVGWFSPGRREGGLELRLM